ncbi:MAG: hypothetical protein COA78_02230 [Blastopirellula sp.]|nr:MAG: hypothetical protein COA78_02230 [Blastopirellula sp.]
MSQESTERGNLIQKPRWNQFRLVHVMYVMSLLGASLAINGTAGIGLAIIIIYIWAIVFLRQTLQHILTELIAVSLVVLLLIWMMIPVVSHAPEAARRIHCVNQMKQIGLALQTYHTTYQSYPPAYVADENGKPMHSWRVLILPFMKQQALYELYDFNEPWDGPNNIKLLDQMPDVFACPGRIHHTDHKNCTTYVAVVGENTAWPGAVPGTVAQITDPLDETLMLVESHVDNILWTEPRDLSLDQFNSGEHKQHDGHQMSSFFYRYYNGRNALMADGSVQYFAHSASADVWHRVIKKSDGASIYDEDLGPASNWDEKDSRQLRIGNCLRLGFFVVVMLLPLPWVWIKPKVASDSDNLGEEA